MRKWLIVFTFLSGCGHIYTNGDVPDLAPFVPYFAIEGADGGVPYAPSGQTTTFPVHANFDIVYWTGAENPPACVGLAYYTHFTRDTSYAGTISITTVPGLTRRTSCGPMVVYGTNRFPRTTVDPSFDVGP